MLIQMSDDMKPTAMSAAQRLCGNIRPPRATERVHTFFYQNCELRYVHLLNPSPPFERELIGATDFDILPAGDARRISDIKRGVLAQRISATAPLVIEANGISRQIELLIEPWLGLQGELLGVAGHAQDVTQQRKLEKALDAQFHEMCTIFDSLELIVYVADFETHELLFTNAFFQRLFGSDGRGQTLLRGAPGRADATLRLLLM